MGFIAGWSVVVEDRQSAAQLSLMLLVGSHGRSASMCLDLSFFKKFFF